ncbi:MAG: hypothetical protein ACLPXB_07735 [Thiobacillaceae bacterium]
MAFTLSEVVPWGRTFEEYLAMFALSEANLATRILGCGDGPASFNAIATEKGFNVVSADPLYQFSDVAIRARIEQTAVTVAEQTCRNANEFIWNHFQSIDELVDARMNAMAAFLNDYPNGRARGRYIDAALPSLPFLDQEFDLALCSHFLFLYSEQFDLAFHVDSLLELSRVASNVRVFPLLELGARPSRHLSASIEAVRSAGLAVSRVPACYEFQRGGNEMLQISHP